MVYDQIHFVNCFGSIVVETDWSRSRKQYSPMTLNTLLHVVLHYISSVLGCVHAGVNPMVNLGRLEERVVCRDWFYPPAVWSPGMELRSSGSVPRPSTL